MYESHTGIGGLFCGPKLEVEDMKRLHVGRESAWLLVSCLVAVAAVGCGADSTGDTMNPPGVVNDPNSMQPGSFNPGGNLGTAGMGSTVPDTNQNGTGDAGSMVTPGG